MEKLTLEHIAPYLPYKMIGKSLGGRMYYLDTFSNMLGEGIENREIGTFLNEQFKPILRLMDLTKPIIVEGKEIIPYHELCKIACNIQELSEHVSYNENDRQLEVIGKKGYKLIFAFDSNDNSFIIMSNGVTKCVSNQLTLFQWLFKHKFDVFGLIEKGLAIDVNTPTTNPYN